MIIRDFIVYKWPDEEFGISIHYSYPDLNLPTVHVDNVTTAITSTGDVDLSGSPIFSESEDIVTQKVSGGTSGGMSTLTFTTYTSSGEIFVDKVLIKVR